MSRFLQGLVIALVLFACFASGAYAAPVDAARARAVAENYLEYVTRTFNRWEGQKPVIASMQPVRHAGATVFWHARVEPAGYLLISPRDELSPVKMYSDSGVFDPARVNTPNAPEAWIIPEQYASVQVVSDPQTYRMAQDRVGDEVYRRIQQAWRVFGQSGAMDVQRIAASFQAAQVGPLVSATWDQGDPYNRQTPLENGQHTLVGCVATAWSMLLHHWQWPNNPVGVHSHVWQDQEFTIDYSKQFWDFEIMPDVLTADSPAESIAAVAELAFQVGVAADMNWGVHSSGSNAWAAEVFPVYFRYKDTAELQSREQFNATQWFNLYRAEFDAQPARPVVMSIYATDGGGHEILADGYQTGATDKIHLNMGWSGAHNAWYDVTSDFTTGGYTWDATNMIIATGLEPNNDGWNTSIGLVNLADTDVTNALLRGFREDGSEVWNQYVSLPGHGSLELDLAQTAGISAQHIKSMRLDLPGGEHSVVGYVKTGDSGMFRAAMEAASRPAQTPLFVPHIASDSQWMTGIGLNNPADTNKTLGFSFADGRQQNIPLAAGASTDFSLRGLFDGEAQPTLESAQVANSEGTLGALLFISPVQMAMIGLNDETTQQLIFPHVAQDNGWWTGIAVYNPNPTPTTLRQQVFTASGQLIAVEVIELNGHGKYVTPLNLATEAAWFAIDASQPVSGFQLFGQQTRDQLAGTSVVNVATRQGVFPRLEPSGWTGLVLVNAGQQASQVSLHARDADGAPQGFVQLTLAPGQKWVGLATELFAGQDIDEASHISFTADTELHGFQLNGAENELLLDGLPVLGADVNRGIQTLYFPYIAVE